MIHTIHASQIKDAIAFPDFMPAMSARVIDGVRVHYLPFKDTSSAYDWTQSAPECQDGDVFVCGATVGVLCVAWPVCVRGEPGALHYLLDGTSWDSYEGGKYAAAARVAQSLKLTNTL